LQLKYRDLESNNLPLNVDTYMHRKQLGQIEYKARRLNCQ